MSGNSKSKTARLNRNKRCGGLAAVLFSSCSVFFLLIYSTGAALASGPAKPDLGPDVMVFDPSMPSTAIQQQIDKIYAIQQHSEFGSERYALLFLPGEYHVD